MSIPILQDFKKEILDVPPVKCDLKVGDRVIVTNDYGLEFEQKIIGFRKEPNGYGGFIYVDWSCYWFAKCLKDVRKQ